MNSKHLTPSAVSMLGPITTRLYKDKGFDRPYFRLALTEMSVTASDNRFPVGLPICTETSHSNTMHSNYFRARSDFAGHLTRSQMT